MGEQIGEIVVEATGRRHPEAQGDEVLIVGAFETATGDRLGLHEVNADDSWITVKEVSGGPEVPIFSVALRSNKGAMRIGGGAKTCVTAISHPWSGIVQLSCDKGDVEVDLYSPSTRVVIIDPETGELREVKSGDAIAASFRSLSAKTEPTLSSGKRVGKPDEFQITALGESSADAKDCEVVILDVEPLGFGVSLDLSAAAKQAGWIPDTEVDAAGRVWSHIAKGYSGTLSFKCQPDGRVVLLRHPWSGKAEISYGDATIVIDLYSPTPDTIELQAREIGQMSESLDFAPSSDDEQSNDEAPARVAHSQRQEYYARLTADIDPHKPVAIYVPRWRGVALSTETLFEQSLPVPAGQEEHPDEISAADIAEYADILVGTGAKHFVISGGDLFNIQIMDAVQAIDSRIRFDMLWHSNFLQMGEPHDWNLLRHWLHALRDGRVHRIGVVKEGLEKWFESFGISSVFIPNFVPFDTESVSATEVDDCVGLWLSGSSHYRKTPHAALSALSLMPGVQFKASGLDINAQQLVVNLGVPFYRMWQRPLPRDMLHKEMRTTGLTFYVTLSECSPMLPLESFANGVPCLVGPASHLFRDDERLRDALVVERPLSPAAIAEKATDVLSNQKGIFENYLDYYRREEGRVKESVARLLA